MYFGNHDQNGPIPPLDWRPRKFVIAMFAILSFNNLVFNTSWFLTDVATVTVQILYFAYAGVLLLLLFSTSFLISRVKIIAALLIFLSAANVFQLGMWGYFFSKVLSKGSEVWIYFSVGACCLVAVLSMYTLRTSRSQVYQIYSSLERMIGLGFIDPKTNNFIWSHSLSAYPRLGPYPRELPRLSSARTSKIFGRSMVVGVYGNFIASVLVAVLSDKALLGIMIFILTLITLLFGHVLWKMVLIYRINGKYRERYGADLVLSD